MFGLVANVISDRVLRTGAKVWIHYCNGDAACPVVSGLCKGGYTVQKYTHYKRLTNFRAAWIHERLREHIPLKWETRAEAEAFAAKLATMWAGIRQYSRDGKTLVRDGEPESVAFKRGRQQ